MQRVGVAGVVVCINLRQRLGHSFVQLRAGCVRIGITHNGTAPLQGQAEQHQQSKKAGAHVWQSIN
jgi:hypothetical protein